MKWVIVIVYIIGGIIYENIAVRELEPDRNKEWVSRVGGPSDDRQANDNCPSTCTCGEPLSKNRIIGGQPAQDKYPWMAFAHSRTVNGTAGCGASIISDQYVLTAAHCIVTTKENMTLIFGTRDLRKQKDAIRLKVDDIKVHENYDPNGIILANDIALLKLEKPVKFDGKGRLNPICLAPEGTTYDGEDMTAIGWGLTSGDGSPTPILQEVNLKGQPDANCKKIFGQKYTDTMLCYGTVNGAQGTCQGDSGGPLHYWNSTIKAFQLTGLVSYGIEVCSSYSAFTRVNKFRDWITTNTPGACFCTEPNPS